MKISIIIPAYNEMDNIKKGVLSEVDLYLRTVKFTYEVIIVDDGSTDGTRILARNFVKGRDKWRIIENQHGGKALTVMTGLLAARGDLALFTDMDQATPLSEIGKIISKYNEGYSIVIGSRAGRKGAPILRKLAAAGFVLLRNLILGLPFADTQCGFKAFNKRSREAIFPKMMKTWEKMRATGAAVHAGFDVETLFIARKLGFRIVAVEVAWHHVGSERVQLVKDSIDAVRDMLRIRLNDFLGKYS